MSMGVTPRQAEIVNAIVRLSADGIPPTLDELAEAVGLASKGNVHHHLVRLRERGVIEFTPGRARSIRVLGEMEGLERRSTADLLALRKRIDVILRRREQ